METTFSFNGRMMLMFGAVQVLLMVLSFCFGTLYGESSMASRERGHAGAPPVRDKGVVKGEAK